MPAHLLVRPMILRAHGQGVHILALPERRLGLTLPLRGDNDVVRRPGMLIRHQQAVAKDLGFQRVQGRLIDRPFETVGPFAPWRIGNLAYLLEILSRL